MRKIRSVVKPSTPSSTIARKMISRLGDRFVELRREFFKDGRYPGSALVTVSNLARPGCVIEIQGVAVI